MNQEEPKIYHYEKSFLLFWHILLGGAFFIYTVMVITIYTKNILQGTLLTLFIALSYLYLLYVSSKFYNKQERGLAYFLTIMGFLVGVFVQVLTCANSVTI